MGVEVIGEAPVEELIEEAITAAGIGEATVLSVNARIGDVIGLAEQVDLATEITNRTNAVTNEQNARSGGDTANTNAITAEITRATAIEGLLIPKAWRGSANGVAATDAGNQISDAVIPATVARDAEVAAAIDAEATARDAAIAAGISAAIAALVASAPGLLNTLDELAAALGDDPNFAATIATALAGKQSLHANLTALAGLVLAANKLPYANGVGGLGLTDFTPFARTLLDDADAPTARGTLGLGTAATHATGDFDTAGAATAAQAAAIAASQPLATLLTNLVALAPNADTLPYSSGAGGWSTTDLSAFARTLLDDANAATARGTLGLGTAATKDVGVANGVASLNASTEINDILIPATIARDSEVIAAIAAEVTARDNAITAAITALLGGAPGALNTLKELADAINDDASFAATVTAALGGKQAQHANLDALAGLVLAADKLQYSTGAGALAQTDLSAYVRNNILGAASAATARTGLGLGTAATHAHGDYEVAGAAALAQTASQPSAALLTVLAGLNAAADKIPYFTGGAAGAVLDFKAWAQGFISAATVAAARTALGLGTVATLNSGVANAGDVPLRSDGDTRWNTGKCLNYLTSTAADVIGTVEADLASMSMSIVVPADKDVFLYCSVPVVGAVTAAASVVIKLTDGANTVKDQDTVRSSTASRNHSHCVLHELLAAGSGTVTRKLRGVSTTADGYSNLANTSKLVMRAVIQ